MALKILVFLVILILVNINTVRAYTGSSWNAIYEVVFDEAYVILPQYKIEQTKFGPKQDEQNNELKKAALRTLTNRDDLFEFPGGQKLLQANGICFAGNWIIDQDSSYSGVLASGSHYPVIARASVALSGTKYTDKRAFAVAVKIFPTQIPDEIVNTINLFVMETIAGKRRQYFHESIFDNAPAFGGLPALGEWGLALRLQSDLKAADRELSPAGPDLAFRPITQLAHTTGMSGGEIHAPKWLRLRVAETIPLIEKEDFRDELNLESYPGKQLIWLIDVADDNRKGKAFATWQEIGRLVLTESITSMACDARLHFAHPVLE